MEATRSELVAELVESALELEPAERINYLDRECGDDAALRGEVESLLKFQSHARHFIEVPGYDAVAEALAISYTHLADLLGANLGRTAEAVANYKRAREILTTRADAADAVTRETLQTVEDHLTQLRR
jgi:AraC-like DNA-binding protein